MSTEETSQPSAIERAARQAAGQAAARIAKQALPKLAAVLGAKGAAVVAAVIALIALVVGLVVLIAVVGAAFQTTTAVWPVPIATDAAGNYQASGWAISSRYGWRDDPQAGGAEFHDGIDQANPNMPVWLPLRRAIDLRRHRAICRLGRGRERRPVQDRRR
jgi:murein DD-endopeptidase MepM/ murein hydrolase activator NlpD